MNIQNKIIVVLGILLTLSFFIFAVMGIVFFTSQYKETYESFINKSVSENVLKINQLANSMQQKASDLAILGSNFYRIKKRYSPDTLTQEVIVALKESFREFPDAIGGGIWFDEYVYNKNNKYFGPYIHWANGDVVSTWDLSNTKYDYLTQDWYTIALPQDWDRTKKRPKKYYWSAPYYDDTGTNSLMITVDAFIYDDNNKIIGLSTVDWALTKMLDTLKKTRTTENSHSFLIEGNSQIIMSYTLDNSHTMKNIKELPWLKKILDDSKKQLENMPIIKKNLLIEKKEYSIYFCKTSANMIYGTMVPKKDILKGRNILLVQIYLLIMIFILLVISVVVLILYYFLHKKDESEKSKLQNMIKSVVDSMPSVIIAIDEKQNIIQLNKKAELVCGISSAMAIGKTLKEVFPCLLPKIALIQKTIEKKSPHYESKVPREENSKVIYEDITIYPLLTNDTKTTGVVIRLDDVTRQKKLEEQFTQSQKMKALGQLVGGVAHDFNNMLGGIIGAAQLLKLSDSNFDQKNLELIDLILQAASRTANLTKKLLAFGRKGKVTSESVDIHKLIDDVVAILERTIDKKIHISIKKEAESNVIIGDASALQNVIMNLGINASHAMPNGGKLQITTKNTTLNKVYCEASPFDIKAGEYIEIEVRDTGCGISRKDLQRIFEPFFTTKEQGKGTGLGLSVVYGTVQDHCGAITVYSEVNKGTVFHIFLPISTDKETDNLSRDNLSRDNLPRKEENKKTTKNSGKILLVDDEEIIRITGKYMLEDMGYTVILAENGQQAVNIFEKQYKEIDLVIMDMIMPQMNGNEAFIKMKEIDSNCKVVMSSGFTKDENLSELKNMGLAGFINKPYRNSELNKLLTDILQERNL